MTSKICFTISGAKPERWFVEHQQLRAAHQRAPNRQHLLLAARQGAAALVQPLLEARKQRRDALEILLEVCAAVDLGAHLQVFEHGHAREDAPAFRRLCDAQMGDLVRLHAA